MDETLRLFSRHLPRTRTYRFYRISCTIFSIQIFTQIFIPSSRERVKTTAFSIKPIEPERCTVSPRISIVYGTKYIEACFTSDTLPPSFLCCSLIDAHREKGIRASPRERGRGRGGRRGNVLYTCIYSTLVPSSLRIKVAPIGREKTEVRRKVYARVKGKEKERERDASPKEISLSNWQILYIVYIKSVTREYTVANPGSLLIYIDICACNFFSSFCARSVDAFRTVLKRGRGEGPLATPRSHARAPSKFREERGRERERKRGRD